MGQDVSNPKTSNIKLIGYEWLFRVDSVVLGYIRDTEQEYQSIYIPSEIREIIIQYVNNVIGLQYLSTPPNGYKDRTFIQLKILMGASKTIKGAAGKTSLIKRYVDNTFNVASQINLINSQVKFVNINNNFCRVILCDPDIASPKTRHNYRIHLRAAHGIFIVFDLTNRESFQYTEQHLKEINESLKRGFYEDQKIIKILIGNKSDLKDKRVITYNEAKQFANKWRIEYIETSAKTGDNVKIAFEMMIKKIYKNYFIYNDRRSVLIHPQSNSQKNNDNCCCWEMFL